MPRLSVFSRFHSPAIPLISMSESGSDLSMLVRPTGGTGAAMPRRRAAWLLPAAVLAGFTLLFLLLFRDSLMPAKAVVVVPARAIELRGSGETAPAAGAEPAAGRLMFQASGWIEPDPLPIKATALTDGVVDTVHVLEGESVVKGQPLADLIEIDARLARDAVARELEFQRANFEAHCVGTQTSLQKLAAEQAGLDADEADATVAADRLDRLDRVFSGAVPEAERIAARAENTRRQAAIVARKARIDEIAHDLNRIAYEILALEAGIKGTEIKLAQAELALERTRIVAPADGRVLRLIASPGQKKMIGMDDEDSATIAILYDPARLQVRVDVPLADAAGLGVGQRARVRSNLLPNDVFEGEVTRILGEADLQRNTLQAKVRIIDPDDKLRPEMICRVEFLDAAPGGSGSVAVGTGASSGALAIFVPDVAIRDGAVWICEPDSRRVSRRAVEISGEIRDGQRRLVSGVRPGEWVVTDPTGLREGQRVRPAGTP